MTNLKYAQPQPREELQEALVIDFDPREHAASEYGLLATEPTVMIVEDEFMIRDLIAEVLKSRGFITIEAEDAETARSILSDPSTRVDVLVSDIRLPGLMDGRDLARDARSQRPDLKVLFLSGYAPQPDESRLDLSTDFMAKPFRLNDVAEHVESLL